MPAVTSADPDRLLRFFEGVTQLDATLTSEARALGRSLDRVAVSCRELLPVLPRVDREVAQLSAQADDVAGVVLGVATGFLRADGGPPGGSSLLWVAGPWGPGGPLAPLGAGSPIGPAIGPIVRFLVGPGRPSGDEVGDMGRWLLQSMTAAAPYLSTSSSIWSILNPVSGWLKITTGSTLAERLVKVPAVARALRNLHIDQAAAVPLLQRVGRGLTAASIAHDIKRLVADGSPVAAWKREGADYLSHWAQLGFDASSQACSEDPSVPTCGAAVVTGVGWAGLEIYERRKAIGRWAETAVTTAPVVAGLLRQFVGRELQAIDDGADALIDEGANRLDGIIRELEHGRGPIHVPTFAARGAEEVVERAREGTHAVKDGAVRAARAAGREVRDGAKTVLHGGANLVREAFAVF